MQRRIALFVDDNLDKTGAITQIYEDQVAEIAAAVHPSHESDGFTGIAGAQRAAHLATLQTAKQIELSVGQCGVLEVEGNP